MVDPRESLKSPTNYASLALVLVIFFFRSDQGLTLETANYPNGVPIQCLSRATVNTHTHESPVFSQSG